MWFESRFCSLQFCYHVWSGEYFWSITDVSFVARYFSFVPYFSVGKSWFVFTCIEFRWILCTSFIFILTPQFSVNIIIVIFLKLLISPLMKLNIILHRIWISIHSIFVLIYVSIISKQFRRVQIVKLICYKLTQILLTCNCETFKSILNIKYLRTNNE